ncbi:MAG: ribosome maturation factor RimM [Pseudomonadota bacterium]
MPQDNLLCIAVITGAHGVHGNLRVRTFSQDPLTIDKYKMVSTESGVLHKVKNVRVHKGDDIIVKFEEVTNRTMAEAMKGMKLYIQRSDLPKLEEEEFYHADLIGLQAQTLEGKPLGTVAAIYNFGAGDLLEIALDQQSSPLILPFTKVCVPEIHIDKGLVVVDISQILSNDELTQIEKVA